METSYRFNYMYPQLQQSSRFVVEPTNNTPYIEFSELRKLLVIKGSSMKENIHTLYDRYFNLAFDTIEKSNEFNCYLCFNKINTSTTKVLFNLFKWVKTASVNGTEINVYWGVSSDDDYIYDIGKDLAEIFDLNLNYVFEN